MTNKFVSIMEQIGHDCLVGLEDVEKYLPAAAELASLLFPQETATIGAVVNSVDLIQKAVVTIEQKMAAAGKATGTGLQKSADVLTMVTPVITSLLASEGLKVDTGYLQSMVMAVVDVLNVRTVPGITPVAQSA